jgi:uncharacterized protein YqeY
MKSKTTVLTGILRLLDSEIQTKALTINKLIDDDLALGVIAKCITQRNKSIEEYTKCNRTDLAQKELDEIDIYKRYQPSQLTTEELTKIVDEQIAESGAKTMKDMGQLMKILRTDLTGKANMELVSEIVKSKLS